MSLTDRQSARSVLWATAIYLFACALSAIFLPSSWLWASGLPTTVSNELGLAFAVFGAYLMALGVGALIASVAPEKNSGLILTLLLCNVFDFLATLSAVIKGDLPAIHGAILVAVTLIWSTLLFLAWLSARRYQ